jgi:hypothetical protein
MEMDMHVYVEVECTKQCQFDVTEYNFTHENTSERTILHLVNKIFWEGKQGLVACTAKKASYAPEDKVQKVALLKWCVLMCFHG